MNDVQNMLPSVYLVTAQCDGYGWGQIDRWGLDTYIYSEFLIICDGSDGLCWSLMRICIRFIRIHDVAPDLGYSLICLAELNESRESSGIEFGLEIIDIFRVLVEGLLSIL